MASKTTHTGTLECLLLSTGASLKQGTSSGWSHLFVAAFLGHVGVVNLLLEAGANKGEITTSGRFGVPEGLTPLEIATAMGHSTVVAALNGVADITGI
jgi:ankyrin repeat protein